MLMKLVVVLSLMLTLQLTSLQAVYKYLGNYADIASLVLLLAASTAYFAMMQPALGRRFLEPIGRGPRVVVLVLTAVIAVSLLLYPIADALKEQMRGSDRDDAIIVGVYALFSGENPYGKTTYFGNPLSPGPGLLLLYAPFVSLKLYALGAGSALGACAYLLKRLYGSWVVASLFVVLVASSLLFWQELAVGSDLIFVGSCYLAIVLLLQQSGSRRVLFLCAVLCGAISTSRIVFLYMPLLFGVLLWPRSKGDAIKFLVTSTAVAIGLHTAFFLWGSDFYTPFHVIGTGEGLMTGNIIYFGIFLCLVAGGFILMTAYLGPDSWVAGLFLSLVTPLFLVFVATLIANGWQIGVGYAASYVTPAVPACCAYAAIRIRQGWLAGQ
jgi:hypothetical protein